MSYFINSVKSATVNEDAACLSVLEKSLINQGNAANISYDVETKLYTFSCNGISASLYSTNDLLNYYFGDNLDDVIEKDNLRLLNQGAGYDIIVYNGYVIGFGANEGVNEEAYAC